MVNPTLIEYIERGILPRYAFFDAAHQRNHAEEVIMRSLVLAKHYDVDENMVYAIAAYHDTGLCEGRDTHHLVSGRIIREDKKLRNWFDEVQIETIAQAAEDHRASSGHEPRSIYGRIVAEADRFIDADTILRRTVQFGLDNYPELDAEAHFQRMMSHLREKYGRGGYLHLWFEDSPNARRLRELQDTIDDEAALRRRFNQIFNHENMQYES